MKALVFTANQQLELTEIEKPLISEDESLVKVEASGICGSDMHAWHGHDERRRPPLILGHEIAGTAVEGKFKGKRVTLNPFMYCEKCEYCLSNRHNICQNRRMISMNQAGGFAEYIKIDNESLMEIPQDLPFTTAALTEPVAVCLHAVNLAKKHCIHNELKNQKVLIIGSGAIGLIIALILEYFGNKSVSICDTNKFRRKTAQKIIKGEVLENAKTSVNSQTFDLIFDAVGSPITRSISTTQVKDGGSIIHVGLQQSGGDFNARKMTIGEVVFEGSFTYIKSELKDALNLLGEGAFGNLDWLETRPLSEGQQAFLDIHNGQGKSAKIVLTL